MTSANKGDEESNSEQFGSTLRERNEKIAHTLAQRAGIDLEAYEDIDIAEIGQNLVSGGPMAHPAAEAYEDLDGTIAKEEVLPRIDDETISEHKNNPIGQHSDKLERVLVYFRRQPVEDKYLLIENEKDEEWRIGKTTGVRGEPPKISDEEPFDSHEEAEHGLFLKRIEDLREKFGNQNNDR